VGPAPKGKRRFVGGDLQGGNRQSRVTPSRRARGFDPEAEPHRRGQESGHRTARAGSYRSDFKGRTDRSTPTEPVASGMSAAKAHKTLYREFRRHSDGRLGKIVRRDGNSAVRLPRSIDGRTRTAHLTESPRRLGHRRNDNFRQARAIRKNESSGRSGPVKGVNDLAKRCSIAMGLQLWLPSLPALCRLQFSANSGFDTARQGRRELCRPVPCPGYGLWVALFFGTGRKANAPINDVSAVLAFHVIGLTNPERWRHFPP
jgi:hypothetical protein